MKRKLTELEKIEQQINKLNHKKWDLERKLDAKKEEFKDVAEKFKNDNGVIAFKYMEKYSINAGRNDIYHYIKYLLDKKLYFIIPIFCFYCNNIKFKNKFLNNLFWNTKWVKVLYKIGVLN